MHGTGGEGDRGATRDPGPVTYGEGPVAEEGGEVPELEREAHGEHDEAERGGVGPRRQRHEPPERLGPRDGHGGRVQPRRRGQRRVPPRRGRWRVGASGGCREALDLGLEGGKAQEQAPPGEGARGPWPRRDPRGGAPGGGGDGAEAEREREEEGSHGGGAIREVELPARGGWFLSRAEQVKCSADHFGGHRCKAEFLKIRLHLSKAGS